MSANTPIEWCDHSLNFWIGCAPVSPGCQNCYAEKSLPARFGRVKWGPGEPRQRTSKATWDNARRWNRQHGVFHAKHGRRQRVFPNSLSDVFDNDVDLAWRVDFFRVILETPNLDYLVLTKRIGNAARMIEEVLQALRDEGMDVPAWPWKNVWLGATVVNQEEAERDVAKLMAVRAVVHFLSIEPMLGAVDLEQACRRFGLHLGEALDWVIVGGESGPQARAIHPMWVQALRDQCVAAGVAFFFKQWGHWRPISQGPAEWFAPLYRSRRRARPGEDQAALDDCYGRVCTVPEGLVQIDGTKIALHEPMAFRPERHTMMTFAVGKSQSGRLLDGREWNEFPLYRPEGLVGGQAGLGEMAAASVLAT